MKRNVYLVGPMAAGKSCIGRELANRLNWPFWDSDSVIEQRTGVDIPTIFEIEGEPGFRTREAETLADLTKEKSIVLATGGGAILDSHNRELLSNTGYVVYLQTTIENQLKRTRHDKKRPLLRSTNPRAKLSELATERDPLYQEVADTTISTNEQSIQASVEMILLYLKDRI